MPTPKRFTREDWIALGLNNLSRHGLNGITIDALCRSAGKTKGSFYSHFESIANFHVALAHQWQQENTVAIINALAGLVPQHRRQAVDEKALALNHDLERHIRQLSFLDQNVAAIVATVDGKRIQWLAQSIIETIQLDHDSALALARLEYGFYVAYQSGLRLSEAEFSATYQWFVEKMGDRSFS